MNIQGVTSVQGFAGFIGVIGISRPRSPIDRCSRLAQVALSYRVSYQVLIKLIGKICPPIQQVETICAQIESALE